MAKKQATQPALITAALMPLAFLVGALLFSKPTQAASGTPDELDIDVAHSVCLIESPAATCEAMVARIAASRPVVASFIPPYKKLTNCREAVDYIFGDRLDYQRAVRVVYRESTNNPNARRPGSQYAGCAQLSATLQATFLQGAWNDPFFNVLALRDAVDSPRWGWCHWDLVNYCLASGEF